MEEDIPDGVIVETNTYYAGDRYTTEQHRRTLEVNGWTFCPVDIMDEEDTLTPACRGRQMVYPHVDGQPYSGLQFAGGAHSFQGAYPGRLRGQQQEYRNRLCRRTYRQGVDTYDPWSGQSVGHSQGGVYGADDGVVQGGLRIFSASI